jgi:phosphoribosylaminoimidazole-succinocarboxamide synthase
MKEAVSQTSLPGLPVRRGKVRDIYDLGERLLMVSTDRISAFDWVLPTPIPDKGRVLTQISAFWFDSLDAEHHLLTLDLGEVALPDESARPSLGGAQHDRAEMPSGTDRMCGTRLLGWLGLEGIPAKWPSLRYPLPPGLQQCSQLAEPIFTPATKEETGHDINISFEQMVEIVGGELAEELRRRSIEIYQRGAEYARSKGILIADTKFEWGLVDGQLILIDEVLTPDSSRFWPADQYQPGHGQPSFDKQFVRDYLTAAGWDKNSPPPELPAEIVEKTREKYIDAYEQLTGQSFAWK